MRYSKCVVCESDILLNLSRKVCLKPCKCQNITWNNKDWRENQAPYMGVLQCTEKLQKCTLLSFSSEETAHSARIVEADIKPFLWPAALYFHSWCWFSPQCRGLLWEMDSRIERRMLSSAGSNVVKGKRGKSHFITWSTRIRSSKKKV